MKKILAIMTVLAVMMAMPIGVSANTYDPEIRIVNVSSLDALVPGSDVTINVYFRNDGKYDAKDVDLTINIDQPGISLLNTTSTRTIDKIEPSKNEIVPYTLKLDVDLEEGVYPVTISGSYLDQHNEEIPYSEVFYLEILGNDDRNFVNVSVDNARFEPGEESEMALTVTNNAVNTMKDVQINVTSNQAGITLENTRLSDELSITAGEAAAITGNLYVSKEVVNGYYTLELLIDYSIGSDRYTEKETLSLWVEKDEEDTETKELTIKSVGLSDSKLFEEETSVMTVIVENISEELLTDVTVEASQDANLVLTTQGKYLFDEIGAGETVTASFTYKAVKSEIERNIPIEVTVTYDEGKKMASYYAGIYVDTMDAEEEDEKKTTPRMVVNAYSVSLDTIYVGDTFDMTLQVQNTSDERQIKNVKMTLETSTSMGPTTSVLPVDQSQSVFIGTMGKMEEKAINIPFEVLASAAGEIYTFDLTFEYEDKDGNLFKDQEKINIPVYQKNDITVSDVRFGKILENGYKLELDFYNTGKTTINNLMIDVEGEFTPLNSNYFVGDFATGRMDIYDVQIQGEAPESVSGTIVITYDDTFGEMVEVKVPFDIENVLYEEPVPEDELGEGESDDMEVTQPVFNPLVFVVPIVVVALVIGLVLFLVFRKKDKK